MGNRSDGSFLLCPQTHHLYAPGTIFQWEWWATSDDTRAGLAGRRRPELTSKKGEMDRRFPAAQIKRPFLQTVAVSWKERDMALRIDRWADLKQEKGSVARLISSFAVHFWLTSQCADSGSRCIQLVHFAYLRRGSSRKKTRFFPGPCVVQLSRFARRLRKPGVAGLHGRVQLWLGEISTVNPRAVTTLPTIQIPGHCLEHDEGRLGQFVDGSCPRSDVNYQQRDRHVLESG